MTLLLDCQDFFFLLITENSNIFTTEIDIQDCKNQIEILQHCVTISWSAPFNQDKILSFRDYFRPSRMPAPTQTKYTHTFFSFFLFWNCENVIKSFWKRKQNGGNSEIDNGFQFRMSNILNISLGPNLLSPFLQVLLCRVV